MVRKTVRGLGETFITLGLVILLFVVYQLYWTGVLARAAMADELDKLHQRIKDTPTVSAPATATPPPRAKYKQGDVFGAMWIPRLGTDWVHPLVAGVISDPNVLHRGLGWYESSQQAGDEGNFAVAGHRKTWGDPMVDFPKLQVGDKVYVEDQTTMSWYVYVLDQPAINDGNGKAVYRTLPDDVHVVDPVPTKAYNVPGHYLTLTTCDPEYGHSHRLIAWGHLIATLPLSAGDKPADLHV